MQNNKAFRFPGWYVILAILFQGPLRADIIYESATLANEGTLGGTSVTDRQTLASRFYIDQPVQVTAIGGHLGTYSSQGTFFGAIVPIEGPDAYPLGSPLEPSEVIASTVFDLVYPSSDYRAPLSAFLDQGYYVVCFGSG